MADYRPANCRFRLQEEGKNYPRSSCAACGRTITTGLGIRCHRETDLVPRADAELAVAQVVERAAGICETERGHWDRGYDTSSAGFCVCKAMAASRDAIRALAPADALARVERLRIERDALVHDNARFVEIATNETNRAEKTEAERDAALARVEKLREALSMIEGVDSHMIASLQSSGDGSVVVRGECGSIARAALDEDALEKGGLT